MAELHNEQAVGCPFVRAFVAIGIGDDVRRSLAEVERELTGTGAHVKWVSPENIHLTLVFLGNTTSDEIGVIGRAIDEAAADTGPFSCEIAGAGFFGRPQSPRVIWVGIGGDVKPLADLQADVAGKLKTEGIDFDNKPFKAHLTLGRVRSPRNADRLVHAMKRYEDTAFGQLNATKVLLMRSELTPSGSHYTVLHESLLSSR